MKQINSLKLILYVHINLKVNIKLFNDGCWNKSSYKPYHIQSNLFLFFTFNDIQEFFICNFLIKNLPKL